MEKSTCRAYTKDEVKQIFLENILLNIRYWDNIAGITKMDAIEGALFSTLTLLDGCSISLPAFDLVVRPHPDDKDYHIENNENYYEEGMVINDECQLHEEFCAIRETR